MVDTAATKYRLLVLRSFGVLGLALALLGCGDSLLLDKTGGGQGTVQPGPSEKLSLTFSKSRYNVMAYWKKGPQLYDESHLLVVLLNEEGTPSHPEGEFHLKLWMPTMGHGSYPVTLKQVSKGVFEASNLFFTMEGRWDIHFQFLDGEKIIIDELLWPLKI